MKQILYKDSMEIEKMKKKAASGYKSLVYTYTKVALNPDDIDWNNVMEAFFFDEKEEIHFLKKEGKLVAVETMDDDDKYTDKVYEVEERFGKEMKVREYYSFDEDGQLSVDAARLVDVL